MGTSSKWSTTSRKSRPKWTTSGFRLLTWASMSWPRSTLTKPGFVPRLVSGKPLKSLNQFYNKQRAAHQSRLSHEHRFTSPHLDRITTKRNRRVDSSLHTASRRIIDLLVAEGIGTLVRSEEHTSELQSRLHLVCR